MKKRIVVIGSTGSIGTQTLEVIDLFPDRFEVVGLAAGSNVETLLQQVKKYKPKLACIGETTFYNDLKKGLSGTEDCKATCGAEGLVEVATMAEADIVVTSITGTLGLVPTVEAIKAGKDIALANKETLVAAGDLVMTMASVHKVAILPVDSEHSAIFQCLNGENIRTVERLILTASGGPFRGRTKDELRQVTPEIALRHPNWSMGPKITIDSATLMNKGLEVIEAKWLFGIDLSRIEVVVHPQSIIHSMVEYTDGSIIAQMGLPDMKLPIQYALTYPDRQKNEFTRLNFAKVGNLTFEQPDRETFESLELAFSAAKQGGTMPAVMNAANEQAVSMFLARKVGFLDIPKIIMNTMDAHNNIKHPVLNDILEADRWAREEAVKFTSGS